MNEAQTRLEKIDPKLKQAGWGVLAESRLLVEQQITKGKVSLGGKAKPLLADYILSYKGKKLAIVEAKSDEKTANDGVMQAKQYADMMNIRFTYATNGDEIYAIDMETGEEDWVDVFPTPEQLWLRTFGTKADIWRDKFYAEPFYTSSGKTPYYYQETAVNRVLETIADDKKRVLLTLATGTGKTFIAFQIAWKLFQTHWNLSKNNLRPRILFLADRNILADQAFNGFGGFADDALVRINPKSIKKNGRVPTNGSVFFTIFQTFQSGDGKPFFGQYPPDFFDLIIIDECHRGGAKDESNWRYILEYFAPAVQLGLTATPRRDINANTYDYFGEPVYSYSLKQGIEDGFLTPFRHSKMQSNLDDYIYQPDDKVLSGEVVEGKTYTESDFYQGNIEMRDRDIARVKEFMKYIAQNEKTLVFCYNQPHAAVIRDIINQVSKKKHPFYCVRVTSDDGEQGEQYLREFQDNEKTIPTVLTTSHKLSTGVDALNVRNIVLLRPIHSMVEFKQIIGRGTRLYDGKYYFTIFDFVKAYEKFNDPSWDGEPVCTQCGNDPCTCETKDPTGPRKPCLVCNQRPCICPKPDNTCQSCGNTPCTCEVKEKLKIKLSDGRIRQIQHIKSDMFWLNGKPVTVETFLETLFGQLPTFFKNEEELRQLWSDPLTRKVLLDKMADAGYGSDVLKQVQRLINAEKSDLYDVLEFVAYATEPLARAERASQAKTYIYPHLSDKQRDFIDFVLQQYVNTGVSELDLEKLPILMKMKFGTPYDGIEILGGIETAKKTFISFQKHLYSASISL